MAWTMVPPRGPRYRNLSFSAVSILLLLSVAGVSGDTQDPKNNKLKSNSSSGNNLNNNNNKSPTKVISLAESINRSQKSLQDPERNKASRKQWESALKEIRELGMDKTKSKREQKENGVKNPFTEWKQLLDNPSKFEFSTDTSDLIEEMTNNGKEVGPKRKPSRFEGFASWERMLQDWADDVNDYLEKIEAENADYPMGTYTKPTSRSGESKNKDETPVKETDSQAEELSTQLESSTLSSSTSQEDMEKPKKKKKSKISLPVPMPAKDGESVLPHTDIADKSKRIWIVTTAALPWMTGTAVNPLLRAAYMTDGRAEAGGSVTLMLPWLERQQDRDSVYGKERDFDTQEEQESSIRKWLAEKAKLPDASKKLKIAWYTAWQNKAENSLYSMGDITALISADDVDIMILEEPEHLNWYRAPGEHWTDKFQHVVGIVHTNYFVYASDQPAAFIRAPGMRLLCSWMCRAHCHRLIKLSGTLGRFAPEKELVENVHGVRASFLETGKEVRRRLEEPDGTESDPVFGAEAEPKVYFIGKMLWSKGLLSLMELLKYAEDSAGIKVQVDMYGGGPDKDAAQARAKSLNVDLDFKGPIDHGDLDLTHKTFINPSTSEVLTTTTAEALAMGKFAVLPSHPSNDFFAQFSNCLTYTNKEEFVGNLYYTLTHSPEPLTDEELFTLSWEAATKRLEAAGSIPVKEAEIMAKALKSNEAGIEISLPPIFYKEEDRQLIASGLRRSRSRFRQFRSRLSQEIVQSTVLPNRVKQLLVKELEKRLDLDIDVVLESPKLELQLSPAELDKRLLELYESVAGGPGGDLLRVIGGGNDVAFQTLYIKRNAAKKRGQRRINPQSAAFGPYEVDEKERSSGKASLWVKKALTRNLIKKNNDMSGSSKQSGDDKKSPKLKMSCGDYSNYCSKQNHVQSVASTKFCPPRLSPASKFTLLI